VRNATQLVAYADRFGGSLPGLAGLLRGPLCGLFDGVHVLPFFTPIDGADAGFDPTDHIQVDDRLGTWDDVAGLAKGFDVTADLIVNHISRASYQFQDFVMRGDASDYAGMFLTREKVFDGHTSAAVEQIYRPRPGAPFTSVRLHDGTERTMWTTFTSEQIDLDVRSPMAALYFDEILARFATSGVKVVRLDAAGYAVKTAGTSCFMTADTFDFIDRIVARCRRLGLEVLVETHAHHRVQMEVAKRVDWVYDFALPPLVLSAIATGDGAPLKRWLAIRPRNAVTVLDTHDGIGVVDVGPEGVRDGLLTVAEIDRLVEGIHVRSGGESRSATGNAASNLDVYQVNCTYYDALGADAQAHLLARALQLFVPGIPQIYYMGLLFGRNDMELLAATGNGRDINRHYYTTDEIAVAFERPEVRRLLGLIRFRNTHPAFGGQWALQDTPDHVVAMIWRASRHRVELTVDLAAGSFRVTDTGPAGQREVTDPDEFVVGDTS
jgi:sucrose phosphorylase